MSKIMALFAALLFVGTLAGAVVAEEETEGERPDRLARLQEHIEKRLARLTDFREHMPDDADTSRLDALEAKLEARQAKLAECAADREACRAERDAKREEHREALLEKVTARTQAALDRIAECRASEDCPADEEKLAALEERLENRLAKLEACSSGEGECDMPKKPHGRNSHLKDKLRERFQKA
jgi:hypothetical protein